MPEPTGENVSKATHQMARLVAAVAIAVLLLAYGTGSQRIRGLQSCRQLPPHGTVVTPVTVCEPVGATSAPIVLGALVIVLLLLPDFGEIAVPGLVTLKRRVEEQDRRQDRLEQRLEANLSQNMTINQNIPVAMDAATLRAATQRVAAAEGDLDMGPDGGDDTGEPAPPSEPESDSDRAQLIVELISLWERLADAANLAETLQRDNRVRVGLAPDAAQSLLNWSFAFSREREYVRAARNAVAHGQPIDIDTLRQAVALAQTLEAALPPLPTLDDPYADALGFERRVYAWLVAMGYEPRKPSDTSLADFVAISNGVATIVEAKLTRRPVTVAILTQWLTQLKSLVDAVPAGKAILVVAAPEITSEALAHASSAWDLARGLEIYREVAPQQFVRVLDDPPSGEGSGPATLE